MTGYLDDPPTAADVTLAYRLLLGREPESEGVLRHHLAQPSRRALHAAFLGSDEYRGFAVAPPPPPPPRLDELLRAFRPATLPKPPPGMLVDEIGVLRRALYRAVAGRQLHPDADQPLEWLATLEAVAGAGERLSVIELGAGHGPWLARAGVAWRRRRPGQPPRLIGVEGEPTHFAWLAQHLADNGLAGPGITLHHAAVAARPGRLRFPRAVDPAREWGARPLDPDEAAAPGGDTLELPAVTLAALLQGEGAVDLLHLDIQGGELAVLTAAGEALRQVGRLCIGTHARDLEAGLLALLPTLGFRLEAETACRYGTPAAHPPLLHDGIQYWVNERPAASR